MRCAKRHLFMLCIITLGCIVFPAALAQEQTVSIQGVATEMEGAPLPGVSITATNTRGATFVASTDNFGDLGQRPTHPHLIDHLAHDFVHEDGWSLKRLIKKIVLSSAWRMACRRLG